MHIDADAVPPSPAPALRAVHCLASALARPRRNAMLPQVFGMEQLGLQPGFLDSVAACAAQLPWDTYDVARRRRQVLQRHASILAPAQRALLEEDDSDPDALWNAVRGHLPSVLRAALKRIQPHRRRAMRKYDARRVSAACWQLQPLDDPEFVQPGVVSRAPRRVFAPIALALTYHPDMLRLVAGIAETIHQRCAATHLQLVLHQMLTIARGPGAAEPAPEGLHQDGADYILSALVVRRRGVYGGTSRVYRGSAGPLLLEQTLGEGEGLFQPDAGSPLWHEVSALHAEDPRGEGQRMILGIDAHVLPERPA